MRHAAGYKKNVHARINSSNIVIGTSITIWGGLILLPGLAGAIAKQEKKSHESEMTESEKQKVLDQQIAEIDQDIQDQMAEGIPGAQCDLPSACTDETKIDSAPTVPDTDKVPEKELEF